MHVKLLLASWLPLPGLCAGGADRGDEGACDGYCHGGNAGGTAAGAAGGDTDVGGVDCGTSHPMQLLMALHMLERACAIAAHVVALVTALVLRKHPKGETE